MSGISHESPKKRRADNRYNGQLHLNQFGEYDDVDPSNRTKSKSHSNMEFKCHVLNSGSNVSSSPFPSSHAVSAIGTGSTARTSKGEDSSMFDSFGNEMTGMGNFVSDFSPMLPGPIRKLTTSKTKAARNGQFDDSRDSPVSSISGASSPSSFFRDGNGNMYHHEPATNSRRTEPGPHLSHAADPYEHAPSPNRQSAMDSLSSARKKTAVQLFSQESPVHSADSPDSLDGSNKLIFDDGVDLDLDDRLAGSADFSVPGLSAAVRLFESSPSTPSGSGRRSSHHQKHMQQGQRAVLGSPDRSPIACGHSVQDSRSPPADNIASRVEQSADYISDTEDDRVGCPSPPHSRSTRNPGDTVSHRSSMHAVERGREPNSDSFPQSTPGRLQFSSAGRSRSNSAAAPGIDSAPSDGVGRLFGGSGIGSGDISPVSMNISFDSAASECRDSDEATRPSALSPARCFGVGGHTLFRDLIRAASDGRSDDDDSDCEGDVSSHRASRVTANRQHRDSARNLRRGTSCGSDSTYFPASASSSMQSPHRSWLSSIRSENDSSPANLSSTSSGAGLWGSLSGESRTYVSNSRSKCSGSARPSDQRSSPSRLGAGPSSYGSNYPGRDITGRSLPIMSGGSPFRPAHRRVRSTSGVPSQDAYAAWLGGDTAHSTVTQPVMHLGYDSKGVPFTNQSSSCNASFSVCPKKSTQSTPDRLGNPLRSRSGSFDQIAAPSSSPGGPNQFDDSGGMSSADLTYSPSRFMEQRHCSRSATDRAIVDISGVDGGADEGGALWLGGSKRSRSPRCVSPRYGSAVGLGPQVSQQDGNEDECVDNRDSRSGAEREISCSSSTDSTSSRRPLPDQSAFDSSHLNTSSYSTALHASPVCPPTPDRAPHWLHESAEFLSESTGGRRGGGFAGDIFSSSIDPMKPPPMRRLNSLCDTKVLVSSMEHSTGGHDGDHSPSHSNEHGPSNSDCSHGAGGTEESIVFHRDFINEGLMGSGTFAEVFRVSLKSDRRQTYAVKKSRRKFRSRKDRENLLNEVRIMQVVGAEPCPHIIQFHRAWQEDGFFYVQIELAERGTLKDLMNAFANQRKRIDDATILRIMHDVSVGMEHVHACHVVHLDIKPPNILIGLDGTLKIGDFGIAMQEGGGADEAHEGDTRYLPEELLNSSERHPSADIFSLGLTLYEICLVPELDVLPYGGALWHDLREGRAVDLSSPAEGGRQEDLCAAICACMSPEPSNRPSAADVLHHPCLASVDFSQPCLALCGATVRAPSPIIFRTNSFCPIGLSSGLCVGTACTPGQEDDDRNLSTPLMGSSYAASLFRMLSPPNDTTAAASALSPSTTCSSHHKQQDVAPSALHGNGDADAMVDGASMATERTSCSQGSGPANYFTPSSHSNLHRGCKGGESSGYFWAQRTAAIAGGESSSNSSAGGATAVSDSSPAGQHQHLHEQCTGSCDSGIPTPSSVHRYASPRTTAKKPSGGRPHGPIRKVKK